MSESNDPKLMTSGDFNGMLSFDCYALGIFSQDLFSILQKELILILFLLMCLYIPPQMSSDLSSKL